LKQLLGFHSKTSLLALYDEFPLLVNNSVVLLDTGTPLFELLT